MLLNLIVPNLLTLTFVIILTIFSSTIIPIDINSLLFTYTSDITAPCGNIFNNITVYIGYSNYCIRNIDSKFENCYLYDQSFSKDSSEIISCDIKNDLQFRTSQDSQTISQQLYENFNTNVFKFINYSQIHIVPVGLIVISIILFHYKFILPSVFMLFSLFLFQTSLIFIYLYIKNSLTLTQLKPTAILPLLISTDFLIIISIISILTIRNYNKKTKNIIIS